MHGVLLGLLFLAAAVPVSAQAPPYPEPVQTLGVSLARTIGVWWTREHDPNMAETDIYQGAWLREGGAPDSVVFDLLPYVTPPREGQGIALAYDAGLGGRMWSGLRDPGLAESALQGLGARLLLLLWRRLAPPPTEEGEILGQRGRPGLLIRFGGEAPHGFTTDGRDVAPLTRMAIGYADLDLPLRDLWHLTIGARAYLSRVPDEDDEHDVSLILRMDRVPPDPGLHFHTEVGWTPEWQRFVLHLERPFDTGGFNVRPVLRLCTARGVPFALGFWPGGLDGFPGLDYGEARGDREVNVGLHVTRHLAWRFSFHASAAVGRTALGGPLLPDEGWVAGLRGGIGLDVGFGEVRAEPGFTLDGRESLFLRVGGWW